MAPKACPGCGTKRDDPAAPCPTCGYTKDPKLGKKVLQFVLLFAILGFFWLLFLLMNMSQDESAPSPDAAPETHGRIIE